MIKSFPYNLFIILILFCSCGTNTDKKESYKDTVNLSEATNIINEATKGIVGDSLLYDTDKEFNKEEANKAEAFVLKTFKIDTTKIFLPGVVYHKNDDSYVVQVSVDRKEYEVTHSTYYKYFPKTQLVLDGVFYDTLYFNYKFYKN